MNSVSSESQSSAAPAIGAKTKLKGDLVAEEDLLIEGALNGSAVLKAHKLTIGASGRLHGQALAKVVSVHGQVEGDLYATELLEVKKGAKIKGNLVATRIAFEDGAQLRGSVEMDPEEVQKAIREKFGAQSSAGAPSQPQSAPASSPSATAPSRPVGVPGSGASAPVGSGTQPGGPRPASSTPAG